MGTAETTFAVDSVAPASRAIKTLPARVAVESILGPKGAMAETCCPSEGSLLPCQFHGFVSAVHLAYAAHYPLVFAPDHIWLMIAQGFAQHIHQNPERWRKVLELPSGRQTLEIRLDDLTRHSPPERWAVVWDGFVELLKREQPSLIRLLTERFSTSGRNESLAYAVTAMEALDPYFRYRVLSICGIPAISLEGTHQDWVDLRRRAEAFASFDLGPWLDVLLPALDQFVAASAGEVDVDWWRRFYKDEGGSGGPYITGHVRAFFPYVQFNQPNGTRQQMPQRSTQTPLTTDGFPSGLSRASFIWQCLDSEISMEVVAGFVGIRQKGESLGLRPEIGWAVREVASMS